MRVKLLAALCAASMCLAACGGRPAPKPEPVAPGVPAAASFSHADFDGLLKKYVVDGTVKYQAWKAAPDDRAKLAEYVKRLGEAMPAAWPENERKAFWINAYNALTLAAALEVYPVKSVNFEESKDSRVKDFWTKPYRVGGATHSINAIENDILRTQFKDSRIHFAINCASTSCPCLQSRSYEAADLDAFLDTVTRDFLNVPEKGLAVKGDTLRISPIFQWYAADFGDVPVFLRRFHPDIPPGATTISYLPYDWTLNEKK